MEEVGSSLVHIHPEFLSAIRPGTSPDLLISNQRTTSPLFGHPLVVSHIEIGDNDGQYRMRYYPICKFRTSEHEIETLMKSDLRYRFLVIGCLLISSVVGATGNEQAQQKSPASQIENRCGWLSNPTPANICFMTAMANGPLGSRVDIRLKKTGSGPPSSEVSG